VHAEPNVGADLHARIRARGVDSGR
jgi:hypothetical protein